MTTYIDAVPAYGRDYKSQKEVRAAWDAGSDFLTVGVGSHGYVNRDDLPDGVILTVRYAAQRNVMVLP